MPQGLFPKTLASGGSRNGPQVQAIRIQEQAYRQSLRQLRKEARSRLQEIRVDVSLYGEEKWVESEVP